MQGHTISIIFSKPYPTGSGFLMQDGCGVVCEGATVVPLFVDSHVGIVNGQVFAAAPTITSMDWYVELSDLYESPGIGMVGFKVESWVKEWHNMPLAEWTGRTTDNKHVFVKLRDIEPNKLTGVMYVGFVARIHDIERYTP